jgi:hypothetical protein
MNAARVPLNFFGMPFGLAGLGVTWLTMAGDGRVPPAVGGIVLAAGRCRGGRSRRRPGRPSAGGVAHPC